MYICLPVCLSSVRSVYCTTCRQLSLCLAVTKVTLKYHALNFIHSVRSVLNVKNINSSILNRSSFVAAVTVHNLVVSGLVNMWSVDLVFNVEFLYFITALSCFCACISSDNVAKNQIISKQL